MSGMDCKLGDYCSTPLGALREPRPLSIDGLSRIVAPPRVAAWRAHAFEQRR